MKERGEQKQVEAGALTRAVEVAAQADFERASAGYGHGWSDMSEAVRDTFRGAAAHAIQAADDHLREHYWAEFRERLLAIAKKCSEQGAAEELAGRSQIPALRHAEAAAIREATFAALATTQHKGGSQ